LCLGWADTYRPPETILVGHVVRGTVTTVSAAVFRSYVEQALTGLLRAGGMDVPTSGQQAGIEAAAIAVKQFAWHRTLNRRGVGYALPDGTCYDVRDDDADIDLAGSDGAGPELTASVATAVSETWSQTMRRPDLPEPFFLSRPVDGNDDGCIDVGAGDALHVDLPIANAIACASDGESRSDILSRYFGTSVRVVDAVELSGADRYGTAVAVSRSILPSATPRPAVVYVASGATFPDALVAGPAAAASDTAVLLVKPEAIPASVAAEIARLKPDEIRVIGGPGAVSDSVVAALRAMAPAVRRISGSDRYLTALAISAVAFPGASRIVFIATGQTYPDALSAGAAAARLHAPLLLVPPVLDATHAAALSVALQRLSPTTIHIAGGPSRVSDEIARWLRSFAPTVHRIAGPDRYATSVELSKAFNAPGSRRLAIATGENFPDALVAAALKAPVLLVPGTLSRPADGTVDEFQRVANSGVTVLGTTQVIRDRVVAGLVGAQTLASGILLPAYFNEGPPLVAAKDADGIPMVSFNGVLEYNPVTIAQYGLAYQARWIASHAADDRTTMVQMADWLVDHQKTDGRWLYTFPFGSQPVPWWSGMAQGQGTSLLLRTYQATGDDAYLDAARRAFAALARPIARAGTIAIDGGDQWIEEYLPPYSTHTLNGFLFALEGVRELSLVTGDAGPTSLYVAGIKTLHDFIPQFASRSWSFYNLGGGKHLASLNYHLIHIQELRHFGLLEGDLRFTAYARLFAQEIPTLAGQAIQSTPIQTWLSPVDAPAGR
jgi:putative cell wall-binding protein